MGPGRQELTSDAFPKTLQLGTNKRRLLFKVKKADNEEKQSLLEKKNSKANNPHPYTDRASTSVSY